MVAMSLNTKTGPKIFTGTFIHSKSRTELEYLHNAIVCVDEAGVITSVTKDATNVATAIQEVRESLGWESQHVEVYTCKEGQFFFPGFIGRFYATSWTCYEGKGKTGWADHLLDTHVHASQYPNVGIFGKTTLLDWLSKYTFPLESSLKDLAKARKVYTACVRRTLAHGTTTAAYYATIDVAATNLLADLCLSIGQRAFVGRVCMDNPQLCPDYYKDESAEAGLKATRETIRHIEAIDPRFEIVCPILTPRFAPSCSSESMKGLAGIQQETGLPVQTHVSENKGEIELVASMFPDSSSYTDVYDRHGLLTPRTVLAHAVHLDEEEAALISSRGTKVSHCPCSNSSLTSGAARVRWLWDKGIEVGLGTDMSGGYSPSILESARQAALVSRHVAMGNDSSDERNKLMVEEVLYLATMGGALCLGLEDKVGGFEIGKQWDAQLVGLRSVDDSEEGEDGNVDVFGWEDWEEKVAKWLYVGDDRNTKKVWVKGREVHSRR